MVPLAAVLPGVTPAAASPAMEQVLLVGNSVAGTVSFINGTTFQNLGSVNVIPDLQQRLDVIYSNPITAIGYLVTQEQQVLAEFEPDNGVRYVDDIAVSPNGQTLYVSRSNLDDVVAIDLTKATHPIIWEFVVSGFHSDHMAISPDGTQLVVSATTSNIAQVINASNGKLIGSFATGNYPHQNDYSANGQDIYNGSIGSVGLPYSLNALKGPFQLTEVNAKTLQVVKTWSLPYGIRPTVITPDQSTAYMQLSYLNGLIKYNLNTSTITDTLTEPLSAFAQANYPTKDDYPHNSAHHGLAMSGDGTKLCDVGTIDNTVSIVSTATMQVTSTVNVGMVPYWASTSADGNYCFVSLSGANEISVISYATGQQVATVPVGAFPQRNRIAQVPPSELGLLSSAVG